MACKAEQMDNLHLYQKSLLILSLGSHSLKAVFLESKGTQKTLVDLWFPNKNCVYITFLCGGGET